MAYLDKYGNLRDDKTGGVIGIKRESGESDESYASRGDAKMSQVNVYGDGTVSSGGQILGKTDNYTPGKINTYSDIDEFATSLGYSKQPVPQQPQFDIQAEIEKLRKAQTDAAVASLGKARDSSLSNLSREKAQIAPQYNAKRNAASTQSQLNAKSFAEYMAGRGGTNSGVAAQAELNRQGQLQGNIGSLNQAEANAFVENDRRVSDVNNAYSSDVAAAEAGAMATALQNTINQMNQDRAFNQAADQFAKTFGLSEAGLTGMYNGSPTLANSQWNKTFDYGVSRDAVSDSQWDKTFESNQSAREFEEWLAQQQLALSRQSAASGGSGGGTATERKQNAYGDAVAKAQEWVQQGYTPQQIRSIIYQNAADFARAGIDADELYEIAFNIHKNYRGNSGGRYTQ